MKSKAVALRASCIVVWRRAFFRSDINYEIFNIMIDAFMKQVVERELYKTIPLSDIIQNVIMVILRGFCTDKGLKYISRLEL